MTTYTIGQVADRTGFTASALRYYEGIGLVEPATRTDAGYRLYDEMTLTRLAFIGRAKQLGCTLEEITDLVGIWDGERCGPVQRRFHELVTTKMADAEHQIAELTALVDQLQHAAAQLVGTGDRWPLRRDLRLPHLRRDDHEGIPMKQARKDGLSVLGIGAAACVACCAGPILAFLGGVSLAGLASTVFIGTAGFVIAAVALAALLVVRRRRNAVRGTR